MPYVSDRMMAHLFEQIALPCAQSEMTMTHSLGKCAGRKCGICSNPNKMKMKAHAAPPRPTRVPLRLHARSSRTENKTQSRYASVSGTAAGVALRLPFQPSLRLRSTVPPPPNRRPKRKLADYSNLSCQILHVGVMILSPLLLIGLSSVVETNCDQMKISLYKIQSKRKICFAYTIKVKSYDFNP
jgi:hypothetical protein